jgi:hypothetical protein
VLDDVVPAEGSLDGSVDVLVLELDSAPVVDPLLAGGSLGVVEELVLEPLDVLSDAGADDGVELEVSVGVELEVSLGVDEDELDVSVGVDEPVDEDELEVSLGADEPVDDDELDVSLGVDELVDEDVDEPPDDGLEDWLGAWVVDEPPDVGVVVPDEPPDDGLVVELSVGELVGSGDPPVAPPTEVVVWTVIGSDAGDRWPAASFAAKTSV